MQSIYGAPFPDEFVPSLKHTTRGVVSMANSGHLDNVYTVFGKVIGGWETLDAIEKVPVEHDRPVTPIRITRITIHANPIAEHDV